MDEKYSYHPTSSAHIQPDSSGLQHVGSDHGPEVVPPLYAHDHSSPEVISKPHFGDGSWIAGTHSPLPSSNQEHYSSSAFPQEPFASNGKQVSAWKASERWCGMRKKIAIIIGAIVLVLIITAVVLGATLGTLLNKGSSSPSSSSQSPPWWQSSPTSTSTSSSPTGSSNQTASHPAGQGHLSVSDKSGLASIAALNEDGMYIYYQLSDGWILETFIDNQNFSTGGIELVTKEAKIGSPLAATSYSIQGVTFRTVFYVDNSSQIMTTNTTDGANWSTPFSVSDNDAGEVGNVALSACSGNTSDGLNGIRVYYGKCSQRGYIQEVGCDFSDSVWYTSFPFENSDSSSGVACVLADTVNRVYLRNTTTSLVQQWQWDYSQAPDSVWTMTGRASANTTIRSGSDIAAVDDGSGTDYIYWQGPSGAVNKGEYSNGSKNIVGLDTGLSAITGSKMLAVYLANASDPGELLIYMSASNEDAMQYSETESDGWQLASGVL